MTPISLEAYLGETPRGRPPTLRERVDAQSDSRRGPAIGTGYWKSCVTCGDPFYVKRSRAHETHCSNQCVTSDPVWQTRVNKRPAS